MEILKTVNGVTFVPQINNSQDAEMIRLLSAIAQESSRHRHALEQIKLYHENMYGAKAKDYIAYDIAVKALEVGGG